MENRLKLSGGIDTMYCGIDISTFFAEKDKQGDQDEYLTIPAGTYVSTKGGEPLYPRYKDNVVKATHSNIENMQGVIMYDIRFQRHLLSGDGVVKGSVVTRGILNSDVLDTVNEIKSSEVLTSSNTRNFRRFFQLYKIHSGQDYADLKAVMNNGFDRTTCKIKTSDFADGASGPDNSITVRAGTYIATSDGSDLFPEYDGFVVKGTSSNIGNIQGILAHDVKFYRDEISDDNIIYAHVITKADISSNVTDRVNDVKASTMISSPSTARFKRFFTLYYK